MNYINMEFDDYVVKEYIEYKYNNSYYKVKCNICGHEKIISIRNMINQDNHCTGLNCGYDSYKHHIGNCFGDYVCISIKKNKGYIAELKCKYCNHTTKANASNINNLSYNHSPIQCKSDYYKTEVGKIYGDYKILSISNNICNQVAVNCECIKCHTKSKKL